MLVHSVYFWLRDDLTAAEHERFVEGLNALLTIESIHHGHAGMPATTNRPVIDRSYSYGLIVFFEDRAGHDAYQDDPIHDRFRDACGDLWRDVKIYDITAT
jgi:hypothetical protein